MKPMRLTSVEELPKEPGWLYEVKYDGFRCLLVWEKNNVQLLTRMGKSLTAQFPEIIDFCRSLETDVSPFLPLTMDGELVYLVSTYKSEFSIVQRRSRMKSSDVVTDHARRLSCHLVVFDLLQLSGEQLTGQSLEMRKQRLNRFLEKMALPETPDYESPSLIQGIESANEPALLWEQADAENGEGLIAKKKTGVYEAGTRSKSWLKKKNWRVVTVVLTEYDETNNYFQGNVLLNGDWTPVVHVRHGFKEEEETSLVKMFRQNGVKEPAGKWLLPPSICIGVACIDFDGKHLREPRFHSFHLDKSPEECTWKTMNYQLGSVPQRVKVTKPDKPVWADASLTKADYLVFLQRAAPYLLPHLKDRLLTVIRYPHGTDGEHFYQKHVPDYAPEFVETRMDGDTEFIMCNSRETLLWLGNQLALEFHTPFQPAGCEYPSEIVLDLDPPSASEFNLAVDAALRLKAVFDELNFKPFVKTSGRKGLQVYLPLPAERFTYAETRQFTSFVCQFLCEQAPDRFTTERLKKNRGNRLYLDYLQHEEGKTIIAPYSPRGTEGGLVATPLYWNEVSETLDPRRFHLYAVLDRLTYEGDPFRFYRETAAENGAMLEAVLAKLTTG
ncbi:DNA ligase D [Salipaludibacillus aurantiacus]|uniref:DNA ligase (ATP) n=1 Tax=Salipaludibacillus aurantiacus TaxID=1601833 RepID=A0A1H9VC13_9BACI|nr:DNA ligase D [Salipaludibacillus aurantiacus]SES18803.1 bifunctional non-homologous end joining protein LigD [Salipaludibacillus aurantiacus]